MKQDSLPVDVLLDIFTRLPAKSICKFQCLSKMWLSNLSDTCNKFKTIETIKPWAIFSHNGVSTESMSSCRELCGYDGLSFGFLSESYSADHKLYVLASSNGLVLCSVVHECTDVERYFVCNPITKESVLLPAPPKMEKNSVGEFSYGLVSDNTHSCCESAFKVVRTQTCLKSNAGFEVQICFSDSNEWRTYSVSYLKPRKHTEEETESIISNVITHNGVVYWIEDHEINRVVAYDLKTNNNYDECDVFNVPILECHLRRLLARSECLGVSAGHVCYAHIRQGGGKEVLRIWVLRKDGDDSIGDDDYDASDFSDDECDYDASNYFDASNYYDYDNYYDDDASNYYDDDDEYDVSNGRLVWRIRREIDLPYVYPKEFWLMGFSPVDGDVVILACGDQIVPYNFTTRKPELYSYQERGGKKKQPAELVHRLSFAVRRKFLKTRTSSSPMCSFLLGYSTWCILPDYSSTNTDSHFLQGDEENLDQQDMTKSSL